AAGEPAGEEPGEGVGARVEREHAGQRGALPAKLGGERGEEEAEAVLDAVGEEQHREPRPDHHPPVVHPHHRRDGFEPLDRGMVASGGRPWRRVSGHRVTEGGGRVEERAGRGRRDSPTAGVCRERRDPPPFRGIREWHGIPEGNPTSSALLRYGAAIASTYIPARVPVPAIA